MIIKSGLTATTLPAHLLDRAITRSQIITITEPEPGKFTLIYEPSDDQVEVDNDDRASKTAKEKQYLGPLFSPDARP